MNTINRHIFHFAICIFFGSQLHAQDSVSIEWYRELPGALSGSDKGMDVLTDPNGNCYVTGISYHTTNKGQFATILYTPDGDTLWTHRYTGASATKINIGRRLAIAPDESVYAVGTISDGGGNIGLIKYDITGMQWIASYASVGFGNYSDDGLDLDIDDAGKIYMIGRVTSTAGSLDDAYTLCVDDAGAIVWSHQFSENSATDYPAAISVSPDGQVYALTSSFNFWGSATHDISTIYYDQDGIQQWVSRYNGSGDGLDIATDIIVQAPQMQYVAGAGFGDEGDMDYAAMLQNEYGTRLWVDAYAGSAGMHDTAFAIAFLPDDAAVITGVSVELIDGVAIHAATTRCMRTDGTLAWSHSYTGPDTLGAAGYAVRADSAGGVYIAGYVHNADGDRDALLLKYAYDGTLLWETSFDGIAHLDDAYTALAIDSGLNIYATGYSGTDGTDAGILTAKYAQSIQDPGDTTSTQISTLNVRTMQVYPNPVSDIAMLYLSDDMPGSKQVYVIDQMARRSSVPFHEMDTNRIAADLKNLPAGIYQLVVASETGFHAAKIMHVVY